MSVNLYLTMVPTVTNYSPPLLPTPTLHPYSPPPPAGPPPALTTLSMTAAIRLALLRCAKYNIGGSIYSLFDLEFSVLRASSEKPRQGAFASTFFASSMSFPQRDPRKQFVLDTPMPLLSFALISVAATSPALTILREPFELVR